jgi:hypothetical protein
MTEKRENSLYRMNALSGVVKAGYNKIRLLRR